MRIEEVVVEDWTSFYLTCTVLIGMVHLSKARVIIYLSVYIVLEYTLDRRKEKQGSS